MCLLIETIKIELGSLHNISYHNQRLNLARKKLWGIKEPINLEEHIQLPDDLGKGLYKCRVLYDRTIDHVSFMPYHPKWVQSLKVVEHDTIDYQYKWADRSIFQKLLEQKDTCDEILIVKRGCITDTSYTNIAFYNGNKWLTPKEPLLRGTQRQKLLDQYIVEEAEIKVSDLAQFQKATLFNAMLEFNPDRSISIEKIV